MSDGLTELVDVEIFVAGAENPVEEQRLLKSVEGAEGIAELSVSGGRMDVRYDPLLVKKIDLVARIKGAGFEVKDVEAAAASPVTDALPGVEPPAPV